MSRPHDTVPMLCKLDHVSHHPRFIFKFSFHGHVLKHVAFGWVMRYFSFKSANQCILPVVRRDGRYYGSLQ